MRTRPLHTLAALATLAAITTLVGAMNATAPGDAATVAPTGNAAQPAMVSGAGLVAPTAASAAVPERLLPTWEPELARAPRPPIPPSATLALDDRDAGAVASQDAQPVYLVYYWRARPGKTADYSAYIHEVAEPIDEAGRQAGAFEWVQTYTPAIQTGAPGADWTHIRIFKLSSFAAWDDFSRILDAAGARVFTPEQRAAQRQRAAPLRDLVRQEIWRAF